METGQDQADGLHNQKDNLVNFDIPVDYSVDCARKQRGRIQANTSFELSPSGTTDSEYNICTKNAPSDLETNLAFSVSHTDQMHGDDAISSTTINYVNQSHIFPSQRTMRHSLREQQLPSLFIPSVCVQSQQMLPAPFEPSIPTDFVHPSYEHSVLAQSGDLETIKRGLGNEIECSTMNQHLVTELDFNSPLAAATVYGSGSCGGSLEHALDTAEEILHGDSCNMEAQDLVCQFSRAINHTDEGDNIVSPAETVVQIPGVFVRKLTGSLVPESRANNTEQHGNRNLLGRVEHCETRNGTSIFTEVKCLNKQYAERKLQSVHSFDLSKNYKDQAAMRTENEVEFSEETGLAESEKNRDKVTLDKTWPEGSAEGEQNILLTRCVNTNSSNYTQQSHSLSIDGYQRVCKNSAGTNMSSKCRLVPNAETAHKILNSSAKSRIFSNIAVLQNMQKTKSLSQQVTQTGEQSHDHEAALTSDLMYGEMPCSGNDATSTENSNADQVRYNSIESNIFEPNANLKPNMKITEHSLCSENSCWESNQQCSTVDENNALSVVKPNVNEIPDSMQVNNSVCESSRSSTSFSRVTVPSLQSPENNLPRVQPCSLKLHKLNVIETDGKCDVRGYVIDLKTNDVTPMSCSISMSLSVAKSRETAGCVEEGELDEVCDEKGSQSSSGGDECENSPVPAGSHRPSRRKQTLVTKYEDEEVIYISDIEEDDVSPPVSKADTRQDQSSTATSSNKKRRATCQQHLNQNSKEKKDGNANRKVFERKILPARQRRGMRLEQIVQNIITQPKSRVSGNIGERHRKSRNIPPTPTRFQPPRRKSSSAAKQRANGDTGISHNLVVSLKKNLALECSLQGQNEARLWQADAAAAEKQNKNTSTSTPGSRQEHATKLSAPNSPGTSSCPASSSKRSNETSREGPASGNKQKLGDSDVKCLNGNGSNSRQCSRKAGALSQQKTSQPRRRGAGRKRPCKSANRKRNRQQGLHLTMFAPDEPEIRLRALTQKNDERRDGRYDSFSPYVRLEVKDYSVCTVVNYLEEDNNNLKQKKHSQHQSHGSVPKTSCLLLGPTINDTHQKSFLICCLCGHSANAMELGDLFGPFYPFGYTPPNVQNSRTKAKINVDQANSNTLSSSCSSPQNAVNTTLGENQESSTREGTITRGQKRKSCDSIEEAAKGPDIKKPNNELSLEDWYQPPLVPMDTNEHWMHEDCVTWCAGVFLVRGKLYGLLEAVNLARETICSKCQKTGATLGCYFKGCPLKYHYACAVESKCLLNEDNFSMKCVKHKDKVLKGSVSAKGESR
ncbi:uncharacterized protein si:dkey-94l16.4 [Callorhinchus milii]|uniref:uncharacterized protein si:dkey-94l16.4 n=1 Tax=Callorhinchus milii TaxID=7868 RepID=UPI001C3F96C7|nr:uncharacterized protein si:dkey-94l16.4 [Callorhinchus milii]XP_007887009.2 uncharacterized protein si:dkey-94l16.4 [Callorhinchus milii]XP_007887013.2 uncharacterized protein si:dkey-94l16.4 [Callorhinchus milii]